ncbi:MAG: tRNA pseudouridine synthase A, partial [Acutalibacteraceae bacterium]|nr:tRNA pseudouridine synthase A [Acutalibacteraceae bacterium]
MRNLLLRLMYNGTAYHGWQVQPNGITVQEALQDAVEKIFGVRENVTGCSRTDSGVHANDFCCNIRTENPIDCYRLVAALNAVLPDDISVKSAEEVPFDFHARYNCVSKQYVYKVWNTNYKNPFLENRAWHYKNKLDEAFLNEQAQQFVGTYDFKAFCSSGSSVEDTVRTVKSFSVERNGDEVLFFVEA